MVNFLINYQCAVRKQAKQKEKNRNGQVRIYLEAKRRCTMSEKMIENNKVSVIGEIVSGFTFSHEVFGEGFYMVDVAVNRLRSRRISSRSWCLSGCWTYTRIIPEAPLRRWASSAPITAMKV